MTRDALLRAIAINPEDDTPRLVFADWLDEYGDNVDREHAALIRAQIALTNLPLDDDRRAELSVAEERLRYHSGIRDRLRAPRGGRGPFSRGFPDRAGLDMFDSRGSQLTTADLAETAEVMERLPIRTFAGDLLGCATPSGGANLPPAGQSGLELLAEWPALARMTGLEATCARTPYSAHGDFRPGHLALARSPHARELKRLQLGGTQIQPEPLAALACALPRLTELTLSDHNRGLTETALGLLLRTPLATRLESFRCAWVDVTAEAIRSLLDQARLSRLAFGVPEEEQAGVGPLLGSSGLENLKELHITGEEHGFDVDEMPYDDDRRVVPHLTELLTSNAFAGLEKLTLLGVALGDDGVRTLANSPAGRSIVELDLSLCGLTGEGLRALRPLLREGRLRRLWLGHNELTQQDAEEMAAWPEFARLHYLEVGYFNDMEDEGRAALQNSANRHPFLKVT